MEKFCVILLLIISTAFNADAACPVNYVEIAGGCYLLLDNIEATFSDARSICEDFHGDLAIVDDCNVLGALTDYFAAAGVTTTGVWIGGTDVAVEGSWQWINGASVAMGAPFWGRTQPENYDYEPNNGNSENCVAMVSGAGYYFQDRPCNSLLYPICQVNPTGGFCPSPYIAIGGSCFQILFSLQVTWQEARIICQSSLGDLAVVSDCHLMSELIAILSATTYWVGGSDLEMEGAWKWINGESMRMGVPFWGRTGNSSLQPDNKGDEHCLTLWQNDRYYFNDIQCHLLRPMLCQTAVV